MRQRALKPWHGVVFFIIVMVLFFFVCVPMQMFWGLYGVAATELFILFLALIFAKIMRYPLKVLFPIKKPGILPFAGVFLIWISTYLLDMVVMLMQYRLFPQQMTEVNDGLNSVIYSVPFLISVLIVAIMPAICEEAVHRGVIIHTLYTVKREWVVVLIMGIYFGLFHSDPFRFLPTAILGAAISYIMLETENMIYPALFHFINNFFPLLLEKFYEMAGYAEDTTAVSMTQVPVASIGIYMIFAAVAPMGIYTGNYLIHHRKDPKPPFFPKDKMVRNILWLVLSTAGLLILGYWLMIYGAMTEPTVMGIY